MKLELSLTDGLRAGAGKGIGMNGDLANPQVRDYVMEPGGASWAGAGKGIGMNVGVAYPQVRDYAMEPGGTTLLPASPYGTDMGL